MEVFMHGRWGRVCDASWDSLDAEVVCRQLGFPGAEEATCCGWHFRRGSGPALMTYVRCTGKESSLFHCSHAGKDEASCSKRSTAGVICKLDKPNGQCSRQISIKRPSVKRSPSIKRSLIKFPQIAPHTYYKLDLY